MDARDIADRCTAVLRARGPAVAAAYLYGSQARGCARPESDVDVAVLLAREPPRTLDGMELDLAGAIEREVGREVDLVVLNRAPAELGGAGRRLARRLEREAGRTAHEPRARRSPGSGRLARSRAGFDAAGSSTDR